MQRAGHIRGIMFSVSGKSSEMQTQALFHRCHTCHTPLSRPQGVQRKFAVKLRPSSACRASRTMRAKTDKFWNSNIHLRLRDDTLDPQISTRRCPWASVSAFYAAVLWVIQVLVELGIWSNTSALHVVVEVQALLVGMNSGISG